MKRQDSAGKRPVTSTVARTERVDALTSLKRVNELLPHDQNPGVRYAVQQAKAAYQLLRKS